MSCKKKITDIFAPKRGKIVFNNPMQYYWMVALLLFCVPAVVDSVSCTGCHVGRFWYVGDSSDPSRCEDCPEGFVQPFGFTNEDPDNQQQMTTGVGTCVTQCWPCAENGMGTVVAGFDTNEQERVSECHCPYTGTETSPSSDESIDYTGSSNIVEGEYRACRCAGVTENDPGNSVGLILYMPVCNVGQHCVVVGSIDDGGYGWVDSNNCAGTATTDFPGRLPMCSESNILDSDNCVTKPCICGTTMCSPGQRCNEDLCVDSETCRGDGTSTSTSPIPYCTNTGVLLTADCKCDYNPGIIQDFYPSVCHAGQKCIAANTYGDSYRDSYFCLTETCDSGQRLDPSGTSCSNCPKGRYQDLSSHTETTCKLCAGGKHQSATGENSCDPCATGKYGYGELERILCVPCELGMYQNLQEQEFCKVCGHGKYQDQTEQSVCLNCDTGKHLDDEGLYRYGLIGGSPYGPDRDYIAARQEHEAESKCIDCVAGYYSAAAATTCTGCEVGKYQDEPIQSSCKPCLEGKYNNQPNSDDENSCKPCLVGRYNDENIGLSVCHACGRGKFNDQIAGVNGAITKAESTPEPPAESNAGVFGCEICQAGKYTAGPAQNTCVDCPVGQYLDEANRGRDECLNCADALAGATSCSGCGLGKFGVMDSNGDGCALCPIGWFAEGGDKNECLICPKGYHGNGATTQQACTMCAVGKWSDTETAVGPPPTVADAETVCKDCAAGKYSIMRPGIQSSNCLNCAVGKYNNYPGKDHDSACLECAPGQWSNVEGHDGACTQCPIGWYSKDYAATGSGLTPVGCKRCPTGWSQENSSQPNCDICLPGTHQDQTNQETCKECPEGQIAPSAEHINCDECLYGKYQNEAAQASCLPCSPGTRQPANGSSGCISCVAGTISAVMESTTCTNCPKGQYQNNTGQTSCVSCMPGKYQDTEKQKSCQDCVLGQYQKDDGQPDCNKVDDGYITTMKGSSYQIAVPDGWKKTSCTAAICTDKKPCGEGTKGTIPASDVCNVCPAGQTSNTASTKCYACNRGTYWRKTELCSNCPKGWYQGKQAQLSCEKCPTGYVASSIGLDSCLDLKFKVPSDCLKDTEYLDTKGNIGDPACDHLDCVQITYNCSKCPPGAICTDDTTDDPLTMGTKPGWWRVPVTFNNGQPLPVLNHAAKAGDLLLARTENKNKLQKYPLFEKCPVTKRCLGDPLLHKLNRPNNTNSATSATNATTAAGVFAFAHLVRNGSLCCNVDTGTCSERTSPCCEGSENDMPLCAVCKVGWTKQGTLGCKKCTGATHAFQLVFLAIASICMLILFYYFHKKMKKTVTKSESNLA